MIIRDMDYQIEMILCHTGSQNIDTYALRPISELLRACLESPDEKSNECKRKNLSRDKKYTLTIFPKPAEFVEPSKNFSTQERLSRLRRSI